MYSPILTSEWSKIGRIYFVAREMEIRIKYSYTAPVSIRISQARTVEITVRRKYLQTVRFIFRALRGGFV